MDIGNQKSAGSAQSGNNGGEAMDVDKPAPAANAFPSAAASKPAAATGNNLSKSTLPSSTLNSLPSMQTNARGIITTLEDASGFASKPAATMAAGDDGKKKKKEKDDRKKASKKKTSVDVKKSKDKVKKKKVCILSLL